MTRKTTLEEIAAVMRTPHSPAVCPAKGMFGRDCQNCIRTARKEKKMPEWINPNIPEPKITDAGSFDVEVEIKANGAILTLTFDSMEEAWQFVDAYANAFYIHGSYEGTVQR